MIKIVPDLALCVACSVTALYLYPWPSVIFGSGPGIDQTLLVEPCKVRVPLLQAEQGTVGRRGCYLLVGDYTALHAQWSRAFWVKRGRKRQMSFHIFPTLKKYGQLCLWNAYEFSKTAHFVISVIWLSISQKIGCSWCVLNSPFRPKALGLVISLVWKHQFHSGAH